MSEVTERVTFDVKDWFNRARRLTRQDQTTTVTRRLTFSAGHRVYGHESKCADPHGHNYVVRLTAAAPKLDQLGRVIDFGVLKSVAGKWLDEQWDHAFLYFAEDPEMCSVFHGREWRSFQCPFNPTAENMAEYLVRTIMPALFEGSGVTVVEVTVEETENCQATARL